MTQATQVSVRCRPACRPMSATGSSPPDNGPEGFRFRLQANFVLTR
jgi:hypothetical protein